MSKKMKRVVMESSPYALYEDAKSRYKLQGVLQQYHQLQKKTEAMRMKLQAVKRNKLRLLAEVRFLRGRYKSLLKNRPPKSSPEQQFSVTQLRNITKDKNGNGKQSGVRNPTAVLGSNFKERIHKGKVAALPNPEPNQKVRVYQAREGGLRNSVPVHDDRVYIGKEAPLRNRVPFLDLNKISREEEEIQFNVENLGVEEPKKYLVRGGNDDQHNDMKLSACRNIGNGPNRAGKRKISWQDQVALRV